MNPAILYLLAGLAAGIFAGHWKPLAFLAPKPPTAQLTAAQADLAKAKADAAAKEQALVAAKTDERAKLEAQIRAAQQDNVGAVEAWKRVPPVHQTAEVKLAGQMTQRVSLKLTAAIGQLPADQQAAMVELIAQALSDKQAEVDEAYAKLAQRDAEFATVTADRDAVKAQIPVLTQKAATAQETALTAESKVAAKTEEVKQWADKKDASDRQAGGLAASLATVWHWALGIAGVWAFLAFVVPGLVKHMASGTAKTVLRAISGYATSPLLFHDASTKLAALNSTQPKT